MAFFPPDDFGGRPYVGGLNQAGHVLVGATLVGILSQSPSGPVLMVAMFIILSWEARHVLIGASVLDSVFDTLYMWAGAALWFYAITHVPMPFWLELAPSVPLLAWCIEYARIKFASGDS